jgi:transformation/transcription domain-associated protein
MGKINIKIDRTMVQEIEAVLKELCGRIKPESEEELQRSLDIVLNKCYKYNIYEELKIPEEIISSIEKIIECPTYFPVDENQKTTTFLKDIKIEFLNDFDIKNIKNLTNLIEILKKWLSILQTKVNLLPSILPIENVSKYLADWLGTEIEIPGQYSIFSDEKEPFIEQYEKLMYFLPYVDVVYRNKISCRRINVRSQSGKIYKFLLQSIPPTIKNIDATKSEERTWALMAHLNKILIKNNLAHSKKFLINITPVIPLSQKIRIIQEKASYGSMEDIFFEFLLLKKKNIDHYLKKHWEIINYEINNNKEKSMEEILLSTYNKIIEEIPSDFLSKYLLSSLPSWNEYFQIRKEFTIQTSLFGLISYLISINQRNLHKILIGRNTGIINS